MFMVERGTNMKKLGIVAFSKPKFDNFLREHPELIEQWGRENIYWINLHNYHGLEIQKIEFAEEIKEFNELDYQKILSRVRILK